MFVEGEGTEGGEERGVGTGAGGHFGRGEGSWLEVGEEEEF